MVNKPTSGANTLLPNGASVSGETTGRYVLGVLQVTRNAVSGTTPVGHGVVLNPQGNSLGAVSITCRAGLRTPDVSYGQNVGGTNKGINRIWTVALTTQPTTAVQLSLSRLADNTNGLSDLTTARAWQQPAVGQPRRTAGPVADASSSLSVSATPTVLNRSTVSKSANPLPFTLTPHRLHGPGPRQSAAGRPGQQGLSAALHHGHGQLYHPLCGGVGPGHHFSFAFYPCV
ncbi:hypothetical protein [Hymenobacter sp. BRD67]|uniref:hypothetical protein n=1 Tax=Hymenobacter sp. BRD67 TaxID=2675877 RepID=UPI00156348B5|nr:hypothetical protein [Hymenobacter sp. BRD67]QKG54464.1 hypothetical protein GKZ67_19990 [Hymenobacter sp. BRD67]